MDMVVKLPYLIGVAAIGASGYGWDSQHRRRLSKAKRITFRNLLCRQSGHNE
jgi:hypothetical protein